MTPNLQRLLFTLLFLTADIRNHVTNHFRPVLKGLTGAGDRLICADVDVLNTKSEKRCQCRNIALDRAVRLNSDKTTLGAESFALFLNNGCMIRVDLRNHHWNIRCPSMCRVIRNYRCLKLRDLLFKRADLILLHINSTEYEIDLLADLLYIFRTLNDHVLNIRRHFHIDLPAAFYCISIRLSGRTRRSNYCYTLKPRMIIKQRDESLSYITCCTNYANS